MQPIDLLTKEELAALIGVQPQTILRWAKEGKIPRIVISPKVIRFDRSRVLESLKGRQDGAAAV
ncbi:MAG: helix-turn-helix domain-containing protein [Anaerohalosphaeraceae bacterium]